MSVAYRIGLTVLFFLTVITRTLCIALAHPTLKDNFLIIAALGIFIFEIICLAVPFVAKK
jgi:hypothetical protein